MKTISRILHEPFYMTEDYARAYFLPSVSAMLKGETFKTDRKEKDVIYAYNDRSFFNKKTSNLENAPAGSVAVYNVVGAMMKYDSFFGTGMMTLEASMREADQLENISAHILVFDSGGGEAAFIDSFAKTIRNEIRKPVIAFINGRCASAAYYVASSCDKIYANEKTDQVGSIGVLVTAIDFKGYYEKQGVKLHEIYATQSSKKNELFTEAYKGNYKPLQKELLNPFAIQFIESVQKFRPGLRDEDAFKGKIYTAAEAEKIGMIDGFKTFKMCIKEATGMSQEPKFQSLSTRPSIKAHKPPIAATQSNTTVIQPSYQVNIDKTVRAELSSLQSEISALKNKVSRLEVKNEFMKSKILEYRGGFEKIHSEWHRMKSAPGAAVTRAFTPIDSGILDMKLSEPRNDGIGFSD